MMKRVLTIILSLIMLTQLGAFALAESPSNGPDGITIGVTTGLSGYFFTDKWGMNTADMDVRELIHGHNTIAWERSGTYALNETVIREMTTTEDPDSGDKTYRIVLNDGLLYNNGTPITAYDYAFSALLLSSPEFAALGGAPTGMYYFAGYEQFLEGRPFSGVRVIDEHTLELTIDGRYLPFFYEIVLLDVTPYPIGNIAPMCAVRDDGGGAYIEGPFTTELLNDMILGDGNGYLHKPYISAGPYRFVSYDANSHEARFTRNEYYAGNFEGVMPTIDEITVVQQDSKTALVDLREGVIDAVNKVSDSEAILAGMAEVETEKLSMKRYLRSGFNFISFACEMGPTQSVNVRRALSHLIDVTAITDEFTGGFGAPVYGYYGLGQWMALDGQGIMTQYAKALDLDEAIALLQEDGWAFNADGSDYDETEGGVRHRKTETGILEKLSLNWAQPEETAMSDVLSKQLSLTAEAAGIELVITKLPFSEQLKHYYRQTERSYHLFSLATNFNLAFDPYPTYHVDDEYQGEANKTGLQDEELMSLTLQMRQTKVGDNEAYLQKWLAFQGRWNALQPMIPLYSNIYFDFYRTDLQEYSPNAYVSWATAIVYAYFGEPSLDAPLAAPDDVGAPEEDESRAYYGEVSLDDPSPASEETEELEADPLGAGTPRQAGSDYFD